ncbi:hypothetical protein NG798_23435 [Ancylothrix sp. C2]|uniref:hypothetical protein n=1 Tax=Ancylothrix sp. D3o TaxID=2953691 RepID=UPI0021BAC6D0|nr:hypothetical protein [Ancylothrix sp. D3o]MCT7952758.1 hypothetical protein [Ancylothrix sp. D3o]
MSNMNQFELENASKKMTLAIRTRNPQISTDILAALQTLYSLEEVAGVMLVTVERLLFWSDSEAVVWTVRNVIPPQLMSEIQRITSVAVYQRLIGKGLIPGQDFSVDGHGKLLLNDRAKTAVLAH